MLKSFKEALAWCRKEGKRSVQSTRENQWKGSELERRMGHQCVWWGQSKQGGTREKPEQGGVTVKFIVQTGWLLRLKGRYYLRWHWSNRWPLGLWVTLITGCVKKRSVGREWWNCWKDFKQRFTFWPLQCGEWIIMRRACMWGDYKLACLFPRDQLKGSFCCCFLFVRLLYSLLVHVENMA